MTNDSDDRQSPRQIVVTGAKGFIGARLCRYLEAQGEVVVPWARNDVDLLDAGAVRSAMRSIDPHVVYHLAASGVRHSRSDDWRVIAENVAMAAHLIEAASSRTRLVVAGSFAEYGVPGRTSEADVCAPKTAYGISKLAATHYALEYGARKGIITTVARLFGVYGPGEPEYRLFPLLLRSVKHGETVALSDGQQKRDFVHVDDVVRCLVALAGCSQQNEIVNVGTGEALQVRQAVEHIVAGLGGGNELLHFGGRARSPGDVEHAEADVTLLRARIGWAPPQRIGPSMDVTSCFEA